MTTAIYARISDDTTGDAVGVDRQVEECRTIAADRGWSDVVTFVDNSISAYSGARRPEFERLLGEVEAGRVNRVITYQSSRLWRRGRDRVRAIEIMRDAKVNVVAVKGPDLDMTTANGRMIAGILGEFDEAESGVKGERVASAALQRARLGYASGGVLYGWERVPERKAGAPKDAPNFHDVENPDEANVVREIVARLLEGDTLRGIADDLNKRDVPTPSRKPDVVWRHTTIRKLAVRPANVSKRIHKGEIIGDAEWPSIVEEASHAKVTALLRSPARKVKRDASRRHLLTYGDIGSCGVCGAVLRVTVKNKNAKYGKASALYTCDGKGCVGRSQAKVDALVEAMVIERLQLPDAVAALAAPEGDVAGAIKDRDDHRARLNAAADQYADGVIDGEQLARITERLRPKVEEAERAVDRLTVGDISDLPAGLVGERAEEVWSALTVVQRRLVCERLNLRVKIMRTRQGPGFRPEDVDVRFVSVN